MYVKLREYCRLFVNHKGKTCKPNVKKRHNYCNLLVLINMGALFGKYTYTHGITINLTRYKNFSCLDMRNLHIQYSA